MVLSSAEPSSSSSPSPRSCSSPPSSTSLSSSSSSPPLHPDSESNKVAKMIQTIKAELCEDWLQERTKSWGPTKMQDTDMPPSWTGTITTKIGSTFHYITCPGHLDSKPCAGLWRRKDRRGASADVYCTYGGWVMYDGKTVADIQPGGNESTASRGGKKNLQQLRRLWAEHVLGQQKKETRDGYILAGMWEWLRRLWGQYALRQEPRTEDQKKAQLVGIWDQAVVDRVHEMLSKGIAQAAKKRSSGRDQEKLLGKGSGGWSGVSGDGVVLKRDTGSRMVANGADRCDLEPGGVWQRGDVEMWTIWNGWTCLVTRDGRWRPAYHLEVLLCLWMTVIDYGPTREAYRNRQADLIRATEWLWVYTPFDLTVRVAEAFRSDSMEMMKRERKRMQSLRPEKYVADDMSTKEQRYRCFQDRAGEVIAYHTVGEGLETPRGYVSAWVMIALNDILDYERDVLCGETNNIVRSLTSHQQVVDAAVWILEALCWSIGNCDHDLTNAIVGTSTLYLVMWRYNGPKLARYKAVSIRDKRGGMPPEMEDLINIVQPTITTTSASSLYGILFDKVHERVQALYGGCTCRVPPDGHDAWKLFAQAMDQGGNDEIEEQLHVALVALNNGANAGDVGCECGVDLLLCEAFVRFLHPDTGIVARLHYRSGNIEQGNTITE